MTTDNSQLTSESYLCQYCGSTLPMYQSSSGLRRKYNYGKQLKYGRLVYVHEIDSSWSLLKCSNTKCQNISVLRQDLYYGIDGDVINNYWTDEQDVFHIDICDTLYKLQSNPDSIFSFDLSLSVQNSIRFLEEFIQDKDVKELIASNLKEIEKSYTNGLYRATIILSGSIFECLLIYAISQSGSTAQEIYRERCRKYESKRPMTKNAVIDQQNQSLDPPIVEWGLCDLIIVAKELKILRGDSSEASDELRNYRNLVHYNKSLSTGLTANAITSRMITLKLEIVFEDVSDWFKEQIK